MEKLDITHQWEQDEKFQALPFEAKSKVFKRFFDDNMIDDSFKQLPENLQNRARSRFVAAQIYPEERIAAEEPRYSLIERALKGIGLPIARESGISEAAKARAVVEHGAREEGVPLSEYREAPEFIEQAAQGFVSGATAGMAPAVQKAWTGEEPIPATDVKGKIGAGIGELGGFVTGPAKFAGEAVTKTMGKVAPWMARALQATGQEGAIARTAKQGVSEAVHLAPAIGIAKAGQAVERETWGEAARDIAEGTKSGALTGAVFGVSRGMFPKDVQQRGRRIIAGLLGLNAQRAIEGRGLPTDAPLEDVVFDTAMDVFFLWHGLGARGLTKAEQDLKEGKKPEVPEPETPEEMAEAKRALYEHARGMRLDDLIQYRDHPRVKPYQDVIDRVIAEKEAERPKRTAQQLQAEIDKQFGVEREERKVAPQPEPRTPQEERQREIDSQWAEGEYIGEERRQPKRRATDEEMRAARQRYGMQRPSYDDHAATMKRQAIVPSGETRPMRLEGEEIPEAEIIPEGYLPYPDYAGEGWTREEPPLPGTRLSTKPVREVPKAPTGFTEPKPFQQRKPPAKSSEGAKSLSSWVKAKGGIWDDSLNGELEQFRGKEQKKARGVVRKGGMPFDEARKQAIEEGFLPKGTDVNGFIDALNKDLGAVGKKEGKVVRMADIEETGEMPPAKLEAAAEDAAILEKKGFEYYGEGHEVAVNSLKEGDKFVRNGEEYTHKGFDEQGRAILVNDVTLKKDVFDKVEAEAVKVEPSIIDEEAYLASKGASRQGIGDAALHKNIGTGRAKKQAVEYLAKKDRELLAKREELRKEYQAKVEAGEIKVPTRTERLIATARGNPDNASVKAARRLLEKKGIEWKGKPVPPEVLKDYPGLGKVEAKTTAGRVWYKDKQYPFKEFREITNGKNEGKIQVKIGLKKVFVDKKDVTSWPESDTLEPKGVEESEVAYGSETKAKERVSQIAAEAEQRYRDKALSSEPVPDNAKDYTSKVARDYAEKGRIDYRGYKLRKGHEAEDIATMFQVYRSEKQEILHAIARDKDGKILAHTALTSGMIDSVLTGDPARYLQGLKSWADRLGADKIDILHNHPSGNVRMSDHDRSLAFYLKYGRTETSVFEPAKGLGDDMGEFVVIDHGKFSHVTETLPLPQGGGRVTTGVGKYKVIPSMNNWMFKKGVQLNSSDKVAAFGAGLKYDKNKVCFIYLDSQHQVQGWTTHNKTILMKSPLFLKDTMRQQIKAHDAKTAVIIADAEPLLKRLLTNTEAMKGGWLLDAQTPSGMSFRETHPFDQRFGLEGAEQYRKAWRLFEPDFSGAYDKDTSKVFRDLLDVIEKGEKREARGAAEPTKEQEKARGTLREHVQAIQRGMKDTGVMRALEGIFKSPEWYDDPRQAEVTDIAIERSSWFHENFNDFNKVWDPFAPFSTVSDAMVALGRKGGISKFRFLMGKRSKQYKQLEDILDEGDVMNKVYTEKDLQKKGYGKDVIHVWKLIRESYDRQLEAMQRPMMELIAEIEDRAKMQGKDPVYPDFGEYVEKAGKRKKLNLKEALMLMGQFKGSYAPRIRLAGNWVVQGKQYAGNYVREHRRSKIAAELLANKLRREGYKDVKVSQKEQILEETFQMLQVMEVNAALERAMATGESVNKYDPDIRMALERDLLTSAADLIKSRGARSTMIPRRSGGVVSGYMTDPIERTIRYTSNNAAGMAKAKAAREMFRVLFGEVKNGERVGGVDQAKEPQVHRAIRKYIEEQLRNPDRADRAIGLAKSLATFKYLGFNPRSIMVNITSLATTAPVALHQYVLNGKGSLTKVLGELARASKDYIKVMKGDELSDMAERRFIEEVRSKGYTDPQYMREAIGHIQGAYGTGWSKAMGGSMWAFGKSEEWVRGGTALAGFRLARKAGMSELDATKAAKTASDKAHGIYGKATLPAIAQGTGVAARTAQLMYVYAKFPHNALQMYYDVGVKKGNIKGLVYALAAPAVLGGAAAFPMKDTIIAFCNTMLKAIGIDRDAEKFVYDTIREQMGEGVEKRIRGGILGEMGIDISGSLAMGPGSIPHELIDLTGAIGGVANDMTQAWRFVRTGQPGRAAEGVLPSAGANILRATRELKGATTRRGYKIWDKDGKPYTPTKGETALRAVGFRSARSAQLAEKTWEAKRERARFNDRRQFIYEKYRAYLMDPTAKARQDVWDDIYAYNKAAIAAGWTPITKTSIKQQIRRANRPTAPERRVLAQ